MTLEEYCVSGAQQVHCTALFSEASQMTDTLCNISGIAERKHELIEGLCCLDDSKTSLCGSRRKAEAWQRGCHHMKGGPFAITWQYV